MKHFWLTAAIILASTQTWGQGLVSCANLNPNLDAPVYNAVTGLRLSGTEFFAQLFAGKAGDVESALKPICAPVVFGDFGYFNGGDAVNNSVLPGSVGTFQVRAWSAEFNTYEEAYAASLLDSNVLLGKSTVFQNPTGINSPEVLMGLQPFSVAPIPEPSVWSLAGFGVLCGWVFLRRK